MHINLALASRSGGILDLFTYISNALSYNFSTINFLADNFPLFCDKVLHCVCHQFKSKGSKYRIWFYKDFEEELFELTAVGLFTFHISRTKF